MSHDMRDNKFGLPPGNWRFDPVTRVQVWVPDDPRMSADDAFDEPAEVRVHPKTGKPHAHFCPDCDTPIRPESSRCITCANRYRRLNNEKDAA